MSREAIRDFFKLRLPTLGDITTLQPMIESAYVRSEQLGCRIYDALYLIIAEVLEYRFVTADRRLYNVLKDRISYVIWIGDLESVAEVRA